MVKGDVIFETDTVSRLCAGSRLSTMGRPLKAAFELSETDKQDEDPYISVNWLEYFAGKSREEQIFEIRAILAKKRTVGAKAKLALLKVGEIHKKVNRLGLNVSVLHWPEITDDYSDHSHSGIFPGIDSDPDAVALALSQVSCEMTSAR